MIDNLLGGGDDDGDSEESDVDDMDGGLFDDGDDLMGGDDDLMGGDDDLMGGDDMGFDEMGGDDGATSAEVDNRIDELENEVASLSSTVNTVKSENEQISESVGDVEENVRKLLEVYEMVTRGVNPFVDESEMGDGSGGGTIGNGSMGLFGDDDEGGSEIDSSVADASADEFFDDDFDDDDFENDSDDTEEFEEEFDDVETGEELEDDFDEEFDDFEDDGENGDGGKSFEELKAEYDSGEAEWDDNGEEVTDADGLDDPETDDPVIGDDDFDSGSDSDFDTPASDPDLDDRDESGDIDAVGDETDSSTVDPRSPIDGGKPYLEALPSGYGADIVVMDWLEFLVEGAGVDGAARTIAYYETIEWLDAAAADALQTFLNGFGGGVEADPDPRSSLTVEHHNTSLRYISRIANPDVGMVAFDERTGRGGVHARSGMGRRERYSERSFESSAREPVNREVESDGGRDIEGSTHRRITPSSPPDRSEHEERSDEAFDWRDDHVE